MAPYDFPKAENADGILEFSYKDGMSQNVFIKRKALQLIQNSKHYILTSIWDYKTAKSLQPHNMRTFHMHFISRAEIPIKFNFGGQPLVVFHRAL